VAVDMVRELTHRVVNAPQTEHGLMEVVATVVTAEVIQAALRLVPFPVVAVAAQAFLLQVEHHQVQLVEMAQQV
jgi:hypothetical protein